MTGNIDELVNGYESIWPGVKGIYKRMSNHDNAVYETFYDAINIEVKHEL